MFDRNTHNKFRLAFLESNNMKLIETVSPPKDYQGYGAPWSAIVENQLTIRREGLKDGGE